VYRQRANLNLDPESLQLVERYEKQFLRAGAKLVDADKTTLKKLNGEISTLTTSFRQAGIALITPDDVGGIARSPECLG
jgi:peptidyl-dipeptidase Dcp